MAAFAAAVIDALIRCLPVRDFGNLHILDLLGAQNFTVLEKPPETGGAFANGGANQRRRSKRSGVCCRAMSTRPIVRAGSYRRGVQYLHIGVRSAPGVAGWLFLQCGLRRGAARGCRSADGDLALGSRVALAYSRSQSAV